MVGGWGVGGAAWPIFVPGASGPPSPPNSKGSHETCFEWTQEKRLLGGFCFLADESVLGHV